MINQWVRDRRAVTRFKCNLPILVTSKTSNGIEKNIIPATTIEISTKGVSFRTTKLPSELKNIQLNFTSISGVGTFAAEIIEYEDGIYHAVFIDLTTRNEISLKKALNGFITSEVLEHERRTINNRRNTSLIGGLINDQSQAELQNRNNNKDKRNNSDRRKDTPFSIDAKYGDFVYEKTVYLSDTNAFGNTYFAKYVEWQGIGREAFLRAIVPKYETIFATGVKWITAEVSMKYKHETRVYDDVLLFVHVGELKRTSLELLFTYINKKNGILIGEGRQLLAFAAPNGRLIELPEPLRAGLQPYLKLHNKTKQGSQIPQEDFPHYFIKNKAKATMN